MTTCPSCSGRGEILRAEGEELLRRASLLTPSRHIRQIDADIASGHVKLRRAERGRALGLGFDRGAALSPETLFASARRHAQQAREQVRAAFGNDEWSPIVRDFDYRSDEFSGSLDEFRSLLMDALDNADLPVADCVEIAGAFDQVSGMARTRGTDGLISALDENLGQLDALLTEDRDWGRQQHSPLEWWQWVIIVSILVISIAALIACFWWSGCSWISAIWAAFCWGTVAAGGFWAGICLGFGF